MTTAAAHPVHAGVAFLRIPEFDSLPTAEQAASKARLEECVGRAIAQVEPARRAVLDADDGIALVLFDSPVRALDLAWELRKHASGQPFQTGLGYGPLALTGGDDPRVFGDGVSQAAAAARFASPERPLVTEGFNRALQATAPERAADLVHAGEFTDTRVRAHEFYTPDPDRRTVRRRKIAVFAVGGTILILLLGVIGRDIYQPLFQSRPAIVKLEVKPRGEVFVDGNSVGKIPPLTQVEIAPGKHKLVVRSPGVKAYEVSLDLAPGQRITLAHTFPPPPPAKADRWRDLKKRFGS
ncbi:MAG TPA: PEGA domain-containing protein [Usitatibacter sp.]|nr:PEGA domain-containing protein [Usitatibacter sp.]